MSSNAKKGRKEGREEGRKEGRKAEKVNACASFEGPSDNRGAEGGLHRELFGGALL